jgi:surfactin synthase thioesterase subunit
MTESFSVSQRVDLLRWGTTTRPTMRLCCFPCAGGGPFKFRSWTKHLPSPVEVVAVRLPGRETCLREAPFSRLELPDHQFIERIRAYNGSSHSVLSSHSLMAFLLPTLRADFAGGRALAMRGRS